MIPKSCVPILAGSPSLTHLPSSGTRGDCRLLLLVGVWTQLLNLLDPMDCSLLGSSVHKIFQGRILESVAISCSLGSSRPRDQSQVSCTAGRFFTIWVTREASVGLITEFRNIFWISHSASNKSTRAKYSNHKFILWTAELHFLIKIYTINQFYCIINLIRNKSDSSNKYQVSEKTV